LRLQKYSSNLVAFCVHLLLVVVVTGLNLLDEKQWNGGIPKDKKGGDVGLHSNAIDNIVDAGVDGDGSLSKFLLWPWIVWLRQHLPLL
jgi:hypothetical protein